jgi:hypothetical protein
MISRDNLVGKGELTGLCFFAVKGVRKCVVF